MQAIHEDGAVGDARQRIGRGLALEVELGLLAAADVADRGRRQRARRRPRTDHRLRFGPAVRAVTRSGTGTSWCAAARAPFPTAGPDEGDVVGVGELVLVPADAGRLGPSRTATGSRVTRIGRRRRRGDRVEVGAALGDDAVELRSTTGVAGTVAMLPPRRLPWGRHRGPEQRCAVLPIVLRDAARTTQNGFAPGSPGRGQRLEESSSGGSAGVRWRGRSRDEPLASSRPHRPVDRDGDAEPMSDQATTCFTATKTGSGSRTRSVKVAAPMAKFTPAHRKVRRRSSSPTAGLASISGVSGQKSSARARTIGRPRATEARKTPPTTTEPRTGWAK